MSEVQAAAERVVAAGVGEPALFEAAGAGGGSATQRHVGGRATLPSLPSPTQRRLPRRRRRRVWRRGSPRAHRSRRRWRRADANSRRARRRIDSTARRRCLGVWEARLIASRSCRPGLHLRSRTGGGTSYAAAAAAGDRLRDFTLLPVLTEAIRRAQAAGVDKGLVDVSSRRRRHDEGGARGRGCSARRRRRRRRRRQRRDGARRCDRAAKPLAAHLPAGCLARAASIGR